MSIEERLAEWLEGEEPIVAVGREDLLTNSVKKTQRTERPAGYRRKVVTTRKWKEFTREGVPVVITDRKLLRMGDATPAGHKAGDAIWRVHKELDHGIPLGDLRSFKVAPVPSGKGLKVRAVPYVGRSIEITVLDGEEDAPRRKALQSLAALWEKGGFAIDDARREALAARGKELSALREEMTGAIVAGRSTLKVVVGTVLAIFAGLPGAAFSFGALMSVLDLIDALSRGSEYYRGDLEAIAVFGGLATVTLGFAALCGGFAAYTGLKMFRASRARERLLGEMAALLDHRTV